MNSYRQTLKTLKKNNPHLSEFINKKFAKLLVKIIFFEIIVGLICAALQKYPFAMISFAVCAGTLVPIFILRRGGFLKRRLFGNISDLKFIVKNTDHAKIHASGGPTFYGDMKEKPFIDCTVADSKDFVLEKKYEKAYKEGDKVMGIPGMEFPLNLTPHEFVACPKCGTLRSAEDPSCVGCGFATISVQNIP